MGAKLTLFFEIERFFKKNMHLLSQKKAKQGFKQGSFRNYS